MSAAPLVPASVAVIQPLPGIGDMIWHLPHIRALARHEGRPVSVLTKAGSHADELLSGDPAVASVTWLEQSAWQTARLLRRLRFGRVVLLHHSRSLALATALAAIPERFGYGFGRQRLFLNRGPFLPADALPRHPFEQATLYLQARGVALPNPEPRLDVSAPARLAARTRLGAGGARFAVLGIGTSEPAKQWGVRNFAALAAHLLEADTALVALLGGPGEAAMAEQIRAVLGPAAARVVPALGWKLLEAAALCAEAAFYVGNDTGAMNLAAAAGTRSFGLFGATAPFDHAHAIVPVMPPDGRIDPMHGMARIDVAGVLAAIARDRAARGAAA